jgi:hypothetical protein
VNYVAENEKTRPSLGPGGVYTVSTLHTEK